MHEALSHHSRPKLNIRDLRRERDSSVSAYKVVLCYNGLNVNYKGLHVTAPVLRRTMSRIHSPQTLIRQAAMAPEP